jgi:mannose-6-phosphate isomerase
VDPRGDLSRGETGDEPRTLARIADVDPVEVPDVAARRGRPAPRPAACRIPGVGGTVRRIALLENEIREYAWGSHTAISELLGRPAPSQRPEAELWIGAHPLAPSHLVVEGRRRSLLEAVEADPDAVLGPRVRDRFGARLPFLLKVIAADRPLSIQAHPDAAQARAGFARENARGIALDAPERCYRDASAKPELVSALGVFRALRGFRPPAEIRQLLEGLRTPHARPALEVLATGPEARALSGLLSLLLRPGPQRQALVPALVDAAAARAGEDPAFELVGRLGAAHPGDPGALAPLLLHRVELRPGDAMFLPAGELHGYLSGVAVEIMANSDNVLRGGLTGKLVDVDELLRVLRFEARPVEVLRPVRDASGAGVYATPAEEFRLARVRVEAGGLFQVADDRGVEILLCSEGDVHVRADADPRGVALGRGASCLVPAAAGAYEVRGSGSLFRASVPL